MAYFKKGEFSQCKAILNGICNSGNLQKELYQYNPQKEKIIDLEDPHNTFPFYMHLNTEEIEVMFLITCIIYETHRTLGRGGDFLSKRFTRFLKNYEVNIFVNSRNNNNDCLFVAHKKIIQGDFKTATEVLLEIPFLQEVKQDFLKMQIKLEAFHCYVEKLKQVQ